MKMLGLLFILCSPMSAREKSESWYQERIATLWKAQTEVVVPNGRVDIESKTHAIEVEFANKWKESIGQSLWYAMQLNKKAGIVLILEDPEKDAIHAIRLRSVLKNSKIDCKVWIWPDDFQSLKPKTNK